MSCSRGRDARAFFAGVAALTMFLAATPAAAINHNVAEDFLSQARRDPAFSTAEWDTAAGELQIPPFVPVMLGDYDTGSFSFDVAVAGEVAYVADALDGLLIFDVSDPAAPTLLGSVNTPEFAGDLAVWGEFALVVDDGTGVLIVDASNPAAPTVVRTVDTPDFARGIAVDGTTAYVTDWRTGLLVIDFSTPATATIVGTLDTPGEAIGVGVAGDLALVMDGLEGIHLVDVSVPSAPSLLASLDTPGYALDVVIAGNTAYVADGDAGVHILDITNPASPSILSTFDSPGFARSVRLDGDLLYLADVATGLVVLDVSNPASPVRVTGFDSPGDVWGVDLQGDFAYLAAFEFGLQVLRIGGAPARFDSLALYSPTDEAKGLFLDGKYLYIARDFDGLEIADVSNPEAPVLVGAIDTGSSVAEAVVASGDFAYLAQSSQGVHVIDVSNPSSPSLVSTFNTIGSSVGLALAGDLLYVADGTAGGLLVLDVSDPASPDSIGVFNSAGAATGVAVWGEFAYLADGAPGLQVIDVGNPAAPSLLTTVNTPGTAEEVAVEGGFAYVADTAQGLRVVDIRNPAAATLVGGVDTPGSAVSVCVRGETAFLADGSAGLRAVDISNPLAPVLGDSLSLGITGRSVTAAGELAFMGTTGATGKVVIALVSERRLVAASNRGQSLELDQSAQPVQRVRLATTQTDSILWEVSATGGAGWEAILPDGDWHELLTPGTDLRWRSTHVQSGPRVNPTCTSLSLEWMYRFAVIDSIRDVPRDQGRQVRLSWVRGTEDEATAADPVQAYEIYRRVDPNLPSLGRESRRGSGSEALAWPPGEWDYVSSVPAHGEDRYATVVPTLGDSTIVSGPYRSSYFLRAATGVPALYFDSEVDSGFSADNLAPAAPGDFFIVREILENELVWGAAEEPDFRYYRVYRSDDPDFTPSEDLVWRETVEARATDSGPDPSGFFYRVSVVDFAGNESEAVAPSSAPNGIGEYTGRAALYQNAPNPFHPSTLIAFDVPLGGRETNLAVYDAQGRLVKTLVGGFRPAGRQVVRWDGDDGAARQVAPGVYFLRLEAGGETRMRKMLMLR